MLPVHPPQIDSLVLHGMKDVIDVHRGKVWIGNVKGDGIARVRIDSHVSGDLSVTLFMTTDAIGRVQIEAGP